MKAKSLLISILLVTVFSTLAFSQQSNPNINVAPNAPKDRVVSTKRGETQEFEEAIKPFVEKARQTYPEVKERFLRGLPPKNTFFITTKLHDSAGRFEQVFVAVKEIKDGKISGLIWSDIGLVSGYKKGDSYTFPESDLVDWTISKPDGTEEGNLVGKFLETHNAQSVMESPVWRDQPATPARTNKKIEDAAVKYQSNAPIPRVVLYDIGYPHNDEEFAALDGNSVILITALAQERQDLPLNRVYVLMDGSKIELKRIKLVLSEESPAKSSSAKTFGAFRADALYLLPVYLRMKSTDLIVDFSRDNTSLKAATFGTPVSADVNKLTIRVPTGVGPSEKFLDEFIKREYPSFFN